jgi:transposase
MESTGVYWKPVYNILESAGLTVLVVNAQHMKAIPGRKTDIKDAEWIADLLRHGLLRASYIPAREQRELRELIRYRRTLVGERASEMSRVQKTLEGANIKLGNVVTDLFGVTGRGILELMINGQNDPEILSQCAKGSLIRKKALLQDAVKGSVGAHQRFMLKMELMHYNALGQMIEESEREIDRRMKADWALVELLDTIPGIGKQTAQLVLAEIGSDMSRFYLFRLCAKTQKSNVSRRNCLASHAVLLEVNGKQTLRL